MKEASQEAATAAAGPHVRSAIDGVVGTIVISNPAKYNAMTRTMWDDFAAAIAELDATPSVHVIVVKGEGPAAFVSGADISQFESERRSEQEQQAYDAASGAAYGAPARAGKPVLAAIRGVCMGGGLGLAAACDLRICSTDARFRMPAARLGIGYGLAGVERFVSLIGGQNVLDIFMTARVFDADEALRMGFVAAVESPERLDARVAEIASALAANAPLSLRAVKRAVHAVQLRQPEAVQAAQASILACARSQDYHEGRKAFLEKRSPTFKGE